MRALEKVEHETEGAFGPEGAVSEELEPKKTFVPGLEADESGEDLSEHENEPALDQGGQSGAHQELPAAVQKLYHSFTGAPQPIAQSRTRSGRDAVSLQAPMRAVDVNHLPPEQTRRPQNGEIGSARGKTKWTGNSRAKYERYFAVPRARRCSAPKPSSNGKSERTCE